MGFYSLVAFNDSGDIVQLPGQFFVLDMGKNVFNTQVDDIDGFVASLKAKGVRVERVNRLDVFETVEPPPLLE